MTDPEPPTEGLDCIVVGGGLAGLACAQRLATRGRSVHVLEADEAPGGRARTVWHRGRPVDRGFQVLFRAYPRTRELLRAIGHPRRDLRPVGGGAVFVDDGGPTGSGASKLAVAALRRACRRRDRARLMRLGRRRWSPGPPEALLEDGRRRGVAPRSSCASAGFSDDAIERVLPAAVRRDHAGPDARARTRATSAS